MRKLWNSIKRNPVLNIFILTALGQFLHDVLANAVDWDNLAVYMATLAMGVIARMFVVPETEHLDAVEKAYMEGLSKPHATPGIPFPKDGER
jgi:metal-dependent HD superfamily phosphatase/phosphodiesterase